MNGQAEGLLNLQHLFRETPCLYKNIISFSSGKGGTGKTFLSLNLAYLHSGKGNKVLLIDLDVSCANVHLLLNEYPQVTLEDYITGRMLFGEIITNYKPNLDIVFGTSGLLTDESMVKQIENGISQVHTKYDIILLDMGPGITHFAEKIISQCSNNIIVMTPEPTSVMDAYAMVKMLSLAEYKGVNNIIINKCIDPEDHKTAFNNLQNACRNFLKTEVNKLGDLDYESSVFNSIKEQKPFINLYPKHEFIKKLNQIFTPVLKKSSLG